MKACTVRKSRQWHRSLSSFGRKLNVFELGKYGCLRLVLSDFFELSPHTEILMMVLVRFGVSIPSLLSHFPKWAMTGSTFCSLWLPVYGREARELSRGIMDTTSTYLFWDTSRWSVTLVSHGYTHLCSKLLFLEQLDNGGGHFMLSGQGDEVSLGSHLPRFSQNGVHIYTLNDHDQTLFWQCSLYRSGASPFACAPNDKSLVRGAMRRVLYESVFRYSMSNDCSFFIHVSSWVVLDRRLDVTRYVFVVDFHN